MSLLCISRKETTKQILFMRSKFNFLHVDTYFDVPKCELSSKYSSLKCWLCFRLFLVADTKIISRHDFVAPLNPMKFTLLQPIFKSETFDQNYIYKVNL